MTNGRELGTGSHPSDLQEAVKAAWEDAKNKNPGLGHGVYECKISIEASNPIHSYIVTIID